MRELHEQWQHNANVNEGKLRVGERLIVVGGGDLGRFHRVIWEDPSKIAVQTML
jgi:hypothetical protein